MKFGKELKKQMVPEWVEAYMDYNGLKGILREVRSSQEPNKPLKALRSFHKSLSGLSRHSFDLSNKGDIENQAIDVSAEPAQADIPVYKTILLMPPQDAGEAELHFFRELDKDLNKVNLFFKDKVDEVLAESANLHKQMDALIALRIKLRNHPESDAPNSSESANTTASNTTSHPGNPEEPASYECINCSDQKQDPLETLDCVEINATTDRPLSAIKNLLTDSKGKHFIKKEELKAVEERMKLVFTEFYQKLRHLKHFSFMNLSAFSKIMKKYEKITSRSAARSYMKKVDQSYIGNSDEVNALLVEVEDLFSKHFFNTNRRECMKLLRHKPKKEKHSVTFFSGFFTGCAVALLIAIILMMNARKLINDGEGTKYLDNMFQLYSLYAFLVLHMLTYAANIYFWKRYRVNYPFIFNFKQGTELGYREVFLLSTGLAVFALASLLVNFHMIMESREAHHRNKPVFALFKLIPLILLLIVLAIILCPFNIIYRSSRMFLMKYMFRCICAPFYEVTLPDFFLGDHLTSQIQAIRSLEFYICYYSCKDVSQTQSKCHDYTVYNAFYFVVGVIPYWIRCLQCIRRLVEERDPAQAYNALKYFLTIIAVVIRSVYELRKRREWLVLSLVSSAIAVMYQTYWDVVMDWGLLRWRSKNFLLRDKLLVSHKSLYFIAMQAVDVLLRVSWLQLVLEFNVYTLQKTAISTFISCLEIIRRGIWSFFRLENEHLNNVGKYRAFRSVPLPFNYHGENSEHNKDD